MLTITGQQPQLLGDHHELFEESSRHTTSSASRRLSRGSSNHRASNSMRVVKPSSANNSPQAPWSNRRRTMMHDTTSSRRTQQVLEQLLTPEDLGQGQQCNIRSNRPVSWHPGSYLQQQALSANFIPQTSQQYSTQGYFTERQQTSPHYTNMSPGMVACSANTSPASAFSPLPMQQYPGFGAHASQYHLPSEAWQAVQKSTPFYHTPQEPRDYMDPFPVHAADAQVCPPSAEGADWQNYIMHGVNTTTPPTPESLMQPEPALPPMPQASPAFQTLDEPEEEGEVLVGMGLYDAPGKLNEDPQLDNYRSTVCSLLGSRFARCEPQGKGLKLEETWCPPPKSDDGEDEDDDDEDEPEATKTEV